MASSNELDDVLFRLLTANTGNLRELAEIAGENPESFYLGTNLRGVDIRGQDLRGMALPGLLLAQASGSGSAFSGRTAMSIETISLRKLMQLMLSSERRRTSLLRANITESIRREINGPSDGGGDFHSPFWADAKAYAAGRLDLRDASAARIEANDGRSRLYPELTEGFLAWWLERRRQRNEPFEIIEQNIKGRLDLPGLGLVKIENNLAFRIGDDARRIVYPYFCEEPDMAEHIARLGLWAMSVAIREFAIADMRILDVIRGRSFSILDTPITGTEEADFRREYRVLLDRWQALRREYP
jgi:hypothetical protein